MNLNLGIIKDINDNIVNHRTLLKIIFNPFLRMFGYQIASRFIDGVFIKYVLNKCPKEKTLWINIKKSWIY